MEKGTTLSYSDSDSSLLLPSQQGKIKSPVTRILWLFPSPICWCGLHKGYLHWYFHFYYTGDSQSKVAPLKTQTIPKLELCSAVLLSKLLSTVSTELSIDLKDVFAWTDSIIAPHRLKTYVANRVVTIVSRIPANHWRHVSSPDNPADIGSRGTSAGVLIESPLWWSGPTWLSQPPDCWPVLKLHCQSSLPDIKYTALTIETHQPIENLTSRFSSFSRLTRVVSWMYRFIKNVRSKLPDRVFSSQLSVKELLTSETVLFKLHQQCFMSKEHAALKAGMTTSF